MNYSGLIGGGIVGLILIVWLVAPIYTVMTTEPTCTQIGITKDIQTGTGFPFKNADKIYLQNGDILSTYDTIRHESDSIANKPLLKCEHAGIKYYQIEETKQ